MAFLKKTFKYLTLFFISFFCFGFISQLATESTWFTSSLGYLFSVRNFHVVREGQIYRSGSMNEEQLRTFISKYGIKTVVDLRYSGDRRNRYGFSEKELVEELGAAYEWVPLVGTKTAQTENIDRLVHLAEKTDRPVLIHCSSGTHRSGIASAIWLMTSNHESPDIAAHQLSPEYGYFYWERRLKSFFLGHETIDAIIWRYLDSYHKSGISFDDWLHQEGDKL